uniref:Uncharacterized protein n=1 Tax=Moniliophthora roreri TaxID=221103 RepID=A0A0W0FSN0_MONRR
MGFIIVLIAPSSLPEAIIAIVDVGKILDARSLSSSVIFTQLSCRCCHRA